ncbi:MAG: LytTR family DNA-binding domain-containing protein [Bacteroidota bacterium]
MPEPVAPLDRPLRVLIVDDEPPARKRLARLLKGQDGFETAGECANGREALDAIGAEQPDLVLLDVQMPELSGLEVLEALDPETMPVVVFVTAYDQHALRAFELHAVDYLLKPFDDERFEVAIGRAKARIERGHLAGLSRRLLTLLRSVEGGPGEPDELVEPSAPAQAPTDRLAIRSGDRLLIVKVEQIDWIEGAGVYAKLHVGPKTHLIRETLTNLAEQLDPERFVRIHRSTIVNRDRVRELRSYFHGEYIVILEDATQLKLSRTYRDSLDQIAGRLG